MNAITENYVENIYQINVFITDSNIKNVEVLNLYSL